MQKSVGRRRTRSGTRRRREIEEKCHTHSLAHSLASSVPFQEIAKKTDADDSVGIGVADLALFAFRKTLSVSQTRDPPNGPNERENYYSKLDIIDLQMDGVILTT